MPWVKIVGHEEYEVSDDGRVRSVVTGIILKPNDARGYRSVQLSGRKRFTIHRLVAWAFLGPKPEGKQINHKNGVKDDNRVENLEYVTQSENMKHAFRLGLQSNKGENHSRHKLTEDAVRRMRCLYENGQSQKQLCEQFSISQGAMSRILNGKRWGHIAQLTH